MYVLYVSFVRNAALLYHAVITNLTMQKNKRGISANTVKTITFFTVKSQSPKMRESQPDIQTKIVHHPGGFFIK
jgi:hypothetical protein